LPSYENGPTLEIFQYAPENLSDSGSIEKIGETFWLIRSPKAKPEQVQGVCKTTQAYAIFVGHATKDGARPTIEEDPAKECSNDRVLWNPLPNGLSPVTGKLDSSATALVFEMKSRYRGIVAIARLAIPYCVWVR
jgi:hypothetical protein